MKKHICIHGHFYQPPRETPWLEEIEYRDPAAFRKLGYYLGVKLSS